MGRKKKKSVKPWCWYCNREFEDEKILLQHQKAKHFKCHICHKKLFTGPGLQIHCMQVHKENIERVPNSIKGRDNITLEICGMDNIPEEDLIEHEKQKQSGRSGGGGVDELDDSDSQDSDFASPSSGSKSSSGGGGTQPPLPPQPPPPPPPLPHVKLPPGTIHGPLPHIPPPAAQNPLMMMNHAMMMPPHMINPYMMAGMGMNPMMMMMPPLPPPPPPPPSQHLMQQQQTAPPPQQVQSQPMPLMGLTATPSPNISSPSHNGSSSLKPVAPLFPAASASLDADEAAAQSQQPLLHAKVEAAAPGSRIVHPEDDISLEEFRASHHKYKYIPPQYSAPAVPNRSYKPDHVYHQNGNAY